MATQLTLRFEEVPLTCEVQARYHAIAGCLAGKKTPAQLHISHLASLLLLLQPVVSSGPPS
jgi:hypothetical protein